MPHVARLLLAALPILMLAGACSSPQAPPETSASPTSEPPAPAAPPPAPGADAAGSAAAASSSSPAPSAQASAAPSPSASAAAAPAAEPPEVEVKNIGMHVGGGKNDAPEKAPIKRSVEPHMPAFAKCFAKTTDPTRGGDFGVDLRIEKDGGKAKVDHPRTSLKGDDFKACVLEVFTAIDFEKPKGGTTAVSYSLRFTPKKAK